MRISRLERYIFREFFGAFLLALTSITAILFIGSALRILSSVPGLDLLFVLEVAPLILPYVTVHAMPLAALVGAVTCYCRLAGDKEVMAMKLTGAPFTRLVTPTIFLGMLLALASMATNNFVSPYCRNQLNAVKRNAVTKIITKLSESRTSVEFHGYKFHWKSVEDGRLMDVLVYRAPPPDPSDPDALSTEPPQMLHARRGTFRLDPRTNDIKFELEGIISDYDATAEGNPWTLASTAGATPAPGAGHSGGGANNGANHGASKPTPDATRNAKSNAKGKRKAKGNRPSIDRLGGTFGNDRDIKLSMRAAGTSLMVGLDSVGGTYDRKAKAKDRDILDLMALRARDLEHERVSVKTIDIEVHRRLSGALSNLTLALLGAAIGLLFTGPNRILAYLVSFAAGLTIYFPLTQVGEGAAENGVLPAMLGLQLGNIGLVVAAFFLFRRSIQ